MIEALTADPMELNISTNPPSQLQQIDQIMLQVNETLNNVDLESPSVLQGTKKRKSLVKRITKLFSKSKSNMKRAGNNTMSAISRWSTRLKPAIVSLFGRALNNPRARSRMQNALDSPEIREAWNAFGLEIEQFRELQEAFDHDNDDSKAIQQSDQHISTVSSPSTSTLSFNSLLSSSSSVINDGSVGSSSDISDTSFHTALSKRDGTGGGSRKSLHDHIQGFKEMLQRNQKTIKIIAGVTAVALLVWCILSLIPLAGIIVIALAMALFAIVLYWK